MKKGYYAEHAVDKSAVNDDYFLHTHTGHEIFMFVKGNCQFNIEGNIYDLQPNDIIIASANELHRVVHLSSEQYERYIIFLDEDFFSKNNCTEFAGLFQNHSFGKNSRIAADFATSSGIVEAIKKIQYYDGIGELTVAKCIIVELLYLLKKNMETVPNENYHSEHMQKIVAYINANLTEDLSLESLAKRFNISVSYIGHQFKKHMRMTVKSYVTYKRLMLARSLVKSGSSLLEASIDAGFTTYSSFYRMYVREFKASPGKDLREEIS